MNSWKFKISICDPKIRKKSKNVTLFQNNSWWIKTEIKAFKVLLSFFFFNQTPHWFFFSKQWFEFYICREDASEAALTIIANIKNLKKYTLIKTQFYLFLFFIYFHKSMGIKPFVNAEVQAFICSKSKSDTVEAVFEPGTTVLRVTRCTL